MLNKEKIIHHKGLKFVNHKQSKTSIPSLLQSPKLSMNAGLKNSEDNLSDTQVTDIMQHLKLPESSNRAIVASSKEQKEP